MFKALPTNYACCPNCSGVYINCWVNFKDIEGARFIAQKYIEDEGWRKVKLWGSPFLVDGNDYSKSDEVEMMKNHCYELSVDLGLEILYFPYTTWRKKLWLFLKNKFHK